MKQTRSTKGNDIKREWHLINAKDKILGRLSSEIALLLSGKSKPYFVRNLDCGDYIVVINSKHVKVTGNKVNIKKYFRHSGYPGGFRSETFKELMDKNPNKIIRHAVSGMLPQNKLKAKMLKRLYVFEEEENKYKDKFSAKKDSA